MPTPQSEMAPGMKSLLLPILPWSSFSNRPASQPSCRVRDSTCITSHTVFPVLIICSSSVVWPSYEADLTSMPVRLLNGR